MNMFSEYQRKLLLLFHITHYSKEPVAFCDLCHNIMNQIIISSKLAIYQCSFEAGNT